MGRAANQDYLDDLALILHRHPKAWYRDNVDGTVTMIAPVGLAEVRLGVAPNRHEAVTVAAGYLRYLQSSSWPE